jgi:simple sugar transport system ATP-binding protein
LPASRLEEGLISGLNIAEHVSLLDKQKGFFVRRQDAFQTAKKNIAKFRIKGEPESAIATLSGGNQQRLLLSFLPADPVLLLLGNPTRGLDMESVRWVWQHLHQYCKHNTCIAFSSSELDEILMVADRVLVFFDGTIIKDTRTDRTDVHELGRAIAGKT